MFLIEDYGIWLLIPFGVALLGLKLPIVPRDGKLLSKQERLWLIRSWIYFPIACFVAIGTLWAAYVVVPFLGLLLPVIAVLYAHSERPLIMAMLYAPPYIVATHLIYSKWAMYGGGGYYQTLMLVISLGPLLYCLPLQIRASLIQRNRKNQAA